MLNIGDTLEPEGLDMITVSGAGTAYVLLYNVYETLLKIDGEGKYQPLLASEWSVSSAISCPSVSSIKSSAVTIPIILSFCAIGIKCDLMTRNL